MAIPLSDNLIVGQQKPLDDKYYNVLDPYANIAAVNAEIPSTIRYAGLTVAISDGLDGVVEYWYQDGIDDIDLVIKSNGPAGPTGPIGLTGPVGPTGPQGPAGNDGANGATGATGATGPSGPSGADGTVGATGPTGPSGADGATGATGPQGAAGLIGLTYLGDYNAGTTYVTTDVVRSTVDGNAYFLQNGPSTNSEPSTDPNWSLFVMEGANGPQGITGATGPSGANGATGATGPTGPSGVDGAVGATGSQGPAGNDGADGATGSQGPAGNDGADGVDGATGPQGPAGNDGADGAGGSLDDAYDYSGSGIGRTIIADSGAVKITGDDGLLVTGTFGSGAATEISGAGTRMFFNPNKAAFRAGYVPFATWNNANIGNYSTAMGNGTTASGSASTALGSGTIASQQHSTAMGLSTNASGIASTTMGIFTEASGSYSTAMGRSTEASGHYSTAMGSNTIASGVSSTTMGESTTAESFTETSIGLYNTDYTPISLTGWSATDRLFVIGNGQSPVTQSDALIMLKNGNTTLNGALSIVDGTEAAGYVLTSDASGNGSWQPSSGGGGGNTLDEAYDQDGAGLGRSIIADSGAVKIDGEDGLLVTGTFGVGAVPEISGTGTRMFFNPLKAAFRAGAVTGTQWDDANIGIHSTAMGSTTTASGDISTAMGAITTASGNYSTAMGSNTDAIGNYSTAMGRSTEASGDYSTAMGYNTNATGNTSTAMGSFTTASGPGSTAMGYQTTASGSNSTTMGYNTEASGDYSTAMGSNTDAIGIRSTAMGNETIASGIISTAMGNETIASGSFSTAMGYNTNAESYVETSIGAFNTDYTPINTLNWSAIDRLFVIGNGTSDVAKSDALIIQKNGNLTMPTTTGAFSPPVLTTTERNTLTATPGMMIFNSTDSKHQGYDGSAWNDMY